MMHQFEHQAMATQYLLSIVEEERAFAEEVATQCFQLLDELELKLSRFVPDSDISRMNKLKAGGELWIDRETWEVLQQAIQVQQWTNGNFDIGVGEHMNIFRAAKQGLLNAFEMNKALETAQAEKQAASLYLDPEHPRFYCVKAGMQFDLGGIGKGYALDQLAHLLMELEVGNYSINAGESTVMTAGLKADGKPWQFTLANTYVQQQIQIANLVVSASGTFHQGQHIFDPRTGKNNGISEIDRVWVACEKGAFSDAFSTGLFLLSVSEITALVDEVSEIIWVAYSKEEELVFLPQKKVKFV